MSGLRATRFWRITDLCRWRIPAEPVIARNTGASQRFPS
jgi:hypothetical protein